MPSKIRHVALGTVLPYSAVILRPSNWFATKIFYPVETKMALAIESSSPCNTYFIPTVRQEGDAYPDGWS